MMDLHFSLTKTENFIFANEAEDQPEESCFFPVNEADTDVAHNIKTNHLGQNCSKKINESQKQDTPLHRFEQEQEKYNEEINGCVLRDQLGSLLNKQYQEKKREEQRIYEIETTIDQDTLTFLSEITEGDPLTTKEKLIKSIKLLQAKKSSINLKSLINQERNEKRFEHLDDSDFYGLTLEEFKVFEEKCQRMEFRGDFFENSLSDLAEYAQFRPGQYLRMLIEHVMPDSKENYYKKKERVFSAAESLFKDARKRRLLGKNISLGHEKLYQHETDESFLLENYTALMALKISTEMLYHGTQIKRLMVAQKVSNAIRECLPEDTFYLSFLAQQNFTVYLRSIATYIFSKKFFPDMREDEKIKKTADLIHKYQGGTNHRNLRIRVMIAAFYNSSFFKGSNVSVFEKDTDRLREIASADFEAYTSHLERCITSNTPIFRRKETLIALARFSSKNPQLFSERKEKYQIYEASLTVLWEIYRKDPQKRRNYIEQAKKDNFCFQIYDPSNGQILANYEGNKNQQQRQKNDNDTEKDFKDLFGDKTLACFPERYASNDNKNIAQSRLNPKAPVFYPKQTQNCQEAPSFDKQEKN